jgi:hypothetical protein
MGARIRFDVSLVEALPNSPRNTRLLCGLASTVIQSLLLKALNGGAIYQATRTRCVSTAFWGIFAAPTRLSGEASPLTYGRHVFP